MSYDFYTEFYDKNKGYIEDRIRKFNKKPSKKRKWMIKNLPDCFNSLYENWYTNLQCISLFTKYYESRNDNKKEDIKAGYRGYLQILDVYKMNSNCSLKNNGKCSSNLWKLLEKSEIDIEQLPPHSFFLSIEFTLKKPFISRDDEEFYIIDNPISKEKVFKIPYIRASSWKGNLRWVTRKIFNDIIDDKKEIQLFGNKKTEEIKFKRGRLQFYPTFFDRIGLDIINPHDRKTKAGTVPIYFEIVPEKTQGEFSLLYVPFDLIGEDEAIVMKEDLLLICNALKLLFEEYGISAKRTSGYGAVEITKIMFKSKTLSELRDFADLDQLIKKIKSSGGD